MMETEFDDFFNTQRFVQISSDKIEEFVELFDEANFLQKVAPLRVPLNFQSIEDECNFFGIFYLLSVGSSFSHRSLEAHQESISDIVLTGVFGAYISHSQLDTNFMKSISPSDAGQYFSLPCTEKVEVSDAFNSLITMEKPGGMLALAELLSKVLVQSGEGLERRGYKSISSLLFDYLPENCESPKLIQMMRALSEVFPHLDDRHIVTIQSKESLGKNVYELPFFNSIRRLLFDICRRFNGQQGITDTGFMHLAGAPSVRSINGLIRLGIVKPLEGGNFSSAADQVAYEIAIRAGAIIACRRLAEAISEKYATIEGVNALSISIYLDNFDRREESENSFIPHLTGITW